MSDRALGRVLDPAALDEASGTRGRVRVEVPAAWLAAACRIEIVAPRRIACARCGGGGCDGCGRSGVLLAPDEEAARRLSITLPGTAGAGVAIRLADPFGPEGGVAQLIVEIHAGAAASPGVERLEEPAPPARPAVVPWVGIAAVLAAAAAILAALLSR